MPTNTSEKKSFSMLLTSQVLFTTLENVNYLPDLVTFTTFQTKVSIHLFQKPAMF